MVIVTKIDHPGLEVYKKSRNPVSEVLHFLNTKLHVHAYPVASYRHDNYEYNAATSTTTRAIAMQLVQNVVAYCGAQFTNESSAATADALPPAPAASTAPAPPVSAVPKATPASSAAAAQTATLTPASMYVAPRQCYTCRSLLTLQRPCPTTALSGWSRWSPWH